MAAEPGGRLRVFMVADRKEAEVDLRWGARQHRGLSTRPCSQFRRGGRRSGRTALRHLSVALAVQLGLIQTCAY